MNACKRHVEQTGADAQHHKEGAGGQVAGGELFARSDQFAFYCIKQVGKDGQPACPQGEDAELDLAAGPEAGQHAAEADADNQGGQEWRDLGLIGAALDRELVDVKLHEQRERPEEHDAKADP